MGRPRDLSTRAVQRVRSAARADGADRSGLSALLSVHALHAAGDALIAVALAGTLFFSVPIGEARSRVALYLVLTMLPFALLVPVAGPVLDRFPHGRRNVLALTTGGRGLLTWVMAGATATLGLYPLALAVLVLSRAYGVARSAAVPRVRPDALGLVSANARLNIAAVTAGALAAGLGSGISALVGSDWVLRLASLVLIVGGVLALRLPAHVDEPPDRESPPPPRFALTYSSASITGPLAAAVALRALAGLLTLFLAFLLRAEGAPGLLVGLVVGAAAVGQLSGTTLAARLPEDAARLLSWVALAGPFVACLGAALAGSDAWVVATAATTGVSVSLSRFAMDAALQQHVTSRSLGSAFARAETALQLSWVVGAFVAVLLPTTAPVGFGVAAALPPLGVLLARQLPRPGEPQDLRRFAPRRRRRD
jgi:MFS family permease